MNAQAIGSLGRLVGDEEFLKGLEGISQEGSEGEEDEEMEMEIDEEGED
jgi:hypothetical protein